MKQLKYIIFPLIALVTIYGCSEDPIDRRLSSSDFFVTFETQSGNANVDTLLIYENVPTVVTVTVAASAGAALDVTFDVIPPEGLSGEATEYELFTMDDAPMSKSLTFENGTGSKSFKFLAKGGGNTKEGTRIFQLALTGNSANYRMGYAMNGDASQTSGKVFPIKIQDDQVIIMDELVGSWKVSETVWQHNGTEWQNEATTYTMSFSHTSGSSITIAGIAGGDPSDVVTATVTLGIGTDKYISLPAQDLPVWQTGYITHFCAMVSGTFANNIGVGFTDGRVLRLTKADDGKISTTLNGGVASYAILALNPERVLAGPFFYTTDTKWEKQ